MPRLLLRCIVLALLLGPCAAGAEPIKLKLAFFTSDRAYAYLAAIKPFVDAVNAEAKGLLEIDVYFSGALGKPGEQWQLLRDGKADIAFVVPGQTPGRFPDTAMIELPGMYRSMREATLVFTRLVTAGAIDDYRDYFVIGSYAVEPESIHTRSPVASLDDLRGKRIRVNNQTLAVTLSRLGMTGVVMPINFAAEDISSGKIDGAAVPLSPLVEFGIGRVATYHYLLPLGCAPLTLMMNRKTLEALPKPAQDIIHKYSGEWTAERFIAAFEAINRPLLEQLKSDAKRKVIVPSQADLDRATRAFKATTEEAVATSTHRRKILEFVQSELAKLRSSQ